MPKLIKMRRQDVAGLRHSSMCGTVYDNGGFDFCLYPEAEDSDVREVSQACIARGMPETGYVGPDLLLYQEDRITLVEYRGEQDHA